MNNDYYCGDAAKVLEGMVEDGIQVQLTVTSPPYDQIRNYAHGHSFDFERVAKALYDITCDGGIVCWHVGDQVKDCDESGTSFEQALAFKQVGFKLLQTLIIRTDSIPFPGRYRSSLVHSYCFILLKGDRPRCYHQIKDRKNKKAGMTSAKNFGRKGKSDELVYGGGTFVIAEQGARTSVWDVPVGHNKSVKDEFGSQHPAVMPEQLARDLIRTYSNYPSSDNAGNSIIDTVLDPFGGAGTTSKMAELLGRNSIYIDISPTYMELAKQRVEAAQIRDLHAQTFNESAWDGAFGLT